MASVSTPITDGLGRANREPKIGYTSIGMKGDLSEASASGVSWAAIFAGAAVASALSLALLALGAGFGFSAMSAWAGEGASAKVIGAGGIAWIIATQIVAAAMGGYLAGRLRIKWSGIHNDEVFFRDTAHGFLVWAVCLVATAMLFASGASALVCGAAKVGGAVAGAAASAAAAGVGGIAASGNAASGGASGLGAMSSAGSYVVDTLFRQDRSANAVAVPSTSADDSATRSEVMRIISNGVTDMSAADKTYVSQLIAAKAGVTPAEAEKRVNDLITQVKAKEIAAREAVDAARKAAAKLSLWTFLGLLIGALSASFAATIGGRQRDSVYA